MTDLLRVRITPEYPGFVISSDGSIQGPSGRWLRPFPDKHGYLRINTYEPPKRWTQVGVHAVVCTAFHGPRPEGMLVRHLDGNTMNNRADNLAWGTFKDNEADKLRHGRRPMGVDHHGAKLTETDVIAIRSVAQLRGVGQELAQQYDVSESTISSIRSRKTWRHI